MRRIMEFLGTETISFNFTPRGLRYLSLKEDPAAQNMNLRLLPDKQKPGSREQLIIRETRNFMETGKHEMPLDFSNFTDFQQRVFAAVGRVEPGTVTTYKGIAEMLGNPRAAQAVGNAVGKNPVAYFLPTHRVLPQRGLGICRTGAGHLRERMLEHEGHDLSILRGNYVCPGKWCGKHI